jgi:hypothetical protein
VLSAALQAFDAAMPHIIYFFTIATAFYQALPVQVCRRRPLPLRKTKVQPSPLILGTF